MKQIKTDRLSLRLSKQDKELITQYAKLMNQNVSELMLSATMREIENEFDYTLADVEAEKQRERPTSRPFADFINPLGKNPPASK